MTDKSQSREKLPMLTTEQIKVARGRIRTASKLELEELARFLCDTVDQLRIIQDTLSSRLSNVELVTFLEWYRRNNEFPIDQMSAHEVASSYLDLADQPTVELQHPIAEDFYGHAKDMLARHSDQPAVAGAAGADVMGIGNMLARCIDDCRKYGWDEWAYEDRLVKLMQEHGSSIVKHLRTAAPSPAVGGEEE